MESAESNNRQQPWELLPAIATRVQRFGLGDDETVDAVAVLAEAAFNLPRPWDMTPWCLRLAGAFVEVVDAIPDSERLESLIANLMRKSAVIQVLVDRAVEFPTKAFDCWKVSYCPASVATLDSEVLVQTLQGVRDSQPGPLWLFELCAVCLEPSMIFECSGAVQELILLVASAGPGRRAAFRILSVLAANSMGLDEMVCPEVLRALGAASQEEIEQAGALFKQLSARTFESHRDLWQHTGSAAVMSCLQHGTGDILRAALLAARQMPKKSYVTLLLQHCNDGAPPHRVLALRALAPLTELQELHSLLKWWFERAPPAAQAAAAEILAEKLDGMDDDTSVNHGISLLRSALQTCPKLAGHFLKGFVESLPEQALQELLTSVPMEKWMKFGSDDVWQRLMDSKVKRQELQEVLKNVSSESCLHAWTELSRSSKTLRKLTQDSLLLTCGRCPLQECFWTFLLEAASSFPDEIARYAHTCISKLVVDAHKEMLSKIMKLGAPQVLVAGVQKYLRLQNSPSAKLKDCICILTQALCCVLRSMPASAAPDDPLQQELQRLKPQLAILARSEDAEVATAAIALKSKIQEMHAAPETKEQRLCLKCRENPKTCFTCNGRGRFVCTRCDGSGVRQQHSTKGSSKGKGNTAKCKSCAGCGHWSCERCDGKGIFQDPRCRGCLALSRNPRVSDASLKRPEEGMTIASASAAELSVLKKTWADRGGYGELVQAWKVTNPLRSWAFARKRFQLRKILGEEPDELEGFHGSAEQNILSICANGFDASRRAGQAFGAGEYFAKSPCVSVGYCRGGGFMLLCRLCLGTQASDAGLGNGDHIWVPGCNYYVIANPDQVLPLYILRFTSNKLQCPKLAHVLSQRSWSSLEQVVVQKVPANRPCCMTAATTDLLWIGYLRPDLSDKELEEDVMTFLRLHAPKVFGDEEELNVQCQPCSPLRLQIVRGKFSQAKVRLAVPVDQATVRALNNSTFTEGGETRTVTVDDCHGSKGQKCTRYIANYCRGRNLRYVDPCRCDHERLPTWAASYNLVPIDLGSAKGDEICSKFTSGGCFHDGTPHVVAINGIQNQTLQALHEKYRAYLTQKNGGEEPKAVDLFHGTNNLILDDIYTHGLSPPSDFKPSDKCPRSGGKGLCTSLCDNRCEFCVERHEWNRCHMFGLGIYLADLAPKSHRYVSQPELVGNRRRYRMVVCSVLTGRTLQLEAHLARPDSLHDVQSLRACWPGELKAKVAPVDSSTKAIQRCCTGASSPPVEQHDLLFVKGLGHRCCPGSSVFNSEYISFHPYQCLPRYEIVYEI